MQAVARYSNLPQLLRSLSPKNNLLPDSDPRDNVPEPREQVRPEWVEGKQAQRLFAGAGLIVAWLKGPLTSQIWLVFHQNGWCWP